MKTAILLCGRKRTGKETSYKIIKKLLPHKSIEEYFFAKPLKDFCINYLGLTYEQMYGSTEQRESLTKYLWGNVAEDIRKKYNKQTTDYLTAREVLQVFGTDVVRNNFYQAVWAEACNTIITNSSADICCVDDTRMINEIEIIKNNKDLNAIVVRVYRRTGLEDIHRSETELDIYDSYANQRELTDPLPGFSVITKSLHRNESASNNVFDYMIDNNSTAMELEENLRKIIELEL